MDVAIRPYGEADVDEMVDAARESLETVGRWLHWCHPDYSRAEAEAWVASRGPAAERGEAYSFVVVDGEGRLLGGCGVNGIDPVHRNANLGYWVRASAESRGVATRAVEALRDWTFSNTDLIRLEIVVSVENHRSVRVAEKAGARREGVARDRLIIGGRPHDAFVFSILKSDRVPVAPGAEGDSESGEER